MVAFKLALAIFAISMFGNVEAQIRGCYYEDWSRWRSGPAQFNKASQYKAGMCTHVFYAFAQISGNTVTGPTDGYPVVKGFKNIDSKVKLLLSIGGAGTAWSFQQLVSNSANVNTWAKNAVAYAKNNGFDGIDVDWEFPTNQKDQFTNLLKALRNNAPSPFLITAAVAAGISNTAVSSYNIGAIKNIVDFLNVMTNFPNPDTIMPALGNRQPGFCHLLGSTTNEWNDAYTIQWYLNQGMPASKLIFGIPTYGAGWTLASSAGGQKVGAQAAGGIVSKAGQFTQAAGSMAQYELCKLGGTRTWDAATKTPFRQSGNQWFSYEDAQSVAEKINFVKSKGLGGAFIWAIDLDDFTNYCGGGAYPIMNAINKQLIGKTF
ncbi:putative chitinase 3 [Aphelenchoides bicaudatus]|nr:putative chitinase 3 [Aphelenchoides bicaudatus]